MRYRRPDWPNWHTKKESGVPVTTQQRKTADRIHNRLDRTTVLVPPLGPIVLRLSPIVELTDDVLLES